MQRIFLLTAAIIFTTLSSSAQNNISGKITLKNGQPATFINVELKELKQVSVTDSSGVFNFSNISNGTYHLLATSAGLQTQEIRVKVFNNETHLDKMVLKEQVNDLDVVILTSNRGLNKQPLSVGKVAIDPMDLPQSITVVGQSVIRDQQTQRLSDVIKNVNGVYLAGTRASTQETFYARGYNFSSNNMFKNGSRVNSGTLPEVSSLEKVEVLKGSAAILYGNVAPGGIINMVTKQPKFKKGGELSLRGGSYGLFKPSIDVYGPISNKLAFRVNGTYEKADSYRDGIQSERFYINPSLLFKISKRTELLVQGDYLDTEFTPDFGIGSLADTVIPNVPRSQFVGTSWQYNKARQTTATAALKHKLNEHWSINTTGAYQLFDRDYYAVERIQAKANGNWARPLGRILTQENYYIGNIDLVGKVKTGKVSHTLLAGVDADRYETGAYTFDVTGKVYDTLNILDLKKYVPRNDVPIAKKITRTFTPVNRFGAYVQDLISLSEKFKLLAGVRWSMQKAEAIKTNYLLKDSVGKGSRTKTDAFSPKVGLVYKPTKGMSAFASYSNSFAVNSGTDVFGNALPASLIDQYEIGIKNELFQGKLSANLTVYRIINNNLAQTARFAADGITVNNNTALKELAGQTTSDGLEIDLASQPFTALKILAGYSYNNMRYTKTEHARGNFKEGERLVNTPAHTANTSFFYTVQKGRLKGLKLGAAGFYVGERFGGWNNTQQQAQAYSRLIPVQGFTTVDISAGYSFTHFSLMTKVSNLFNEYNYYVHENYSVNPIAPRQFIATVSVKL